MNLWINFPTPLLPWYNKGMTKVGIPILLVVFLSFSGFVYAAGTPTILSYQGRLANADGDVLGGSGTTYYFKFSIWDNVTVESGNQLWPSSAPTATTATVKQGVFNINIGDTANGYPDALNYNFNTNANVYLEVKVSSNGSSFETLSPRQRIASALFAQLAGAVSGTGQSSVGTTTPISGAVLTAEATTTSAVPLAIRGFLNQTADLFRAISAAGVRLLTITSAGKLGIGTTTPSRKLDILDVDSVPQLRLSQTNAIYGEFYTDSSGDLRISSTGGNVRQNNENFWVCSDGGCAVSTPITKGNVVVETSLILDNGFYLKKVNASTTVMYDTTDTSILEFDEVRP